MEQSIRSVKALALWQRLRDRLSDENQGRVLALALPAVGEQVLNMAVGLVDTFLVGHVGAEAVAAVGLANQAVLIVTTFFAAVATGVTALVARHHGAHEARGANTILHQGYLLGLLLGVITMALGQAFSTPAMRALQAPPEIVAPSAQYLRIVALTFVLASWLFVGNAALRGSGDTRTPMYVMLAVNVINVLVAYVAINGVGPVPALGVTGSAIGATVGRGAGGLLVTLVLLKGHRGLRLRAAHLTLALDQVKRILNIGLPAGAEQLVMRLGQTAFAMTVASLGTQAYAAHQLAQQGESLSYMPGFGFAVAATTLTGQWLGADKPEQARADAIMAQRLAMVVMSLMGVLFFLFPTQIIGVFISDPEVIRMGVWPLRLEAFSQPALASLMALSGSLRGAGDTRMTLAITGGGLWLVRVPLALLLVHHFGLLGAWIAMGLDLNLRNLFMWLRFRSGQWMNIRV